MSQAGCQNRALEVWRAWIMNTEVLRNLQAGLRRRRRAFTLVELMVVAIVMAVLAAAVAPAMISAVRRTGASTAAVRIADLLDFAHTAAVTRGQAVLVSFDLQQHVCRATATVARLPWLSEGTGAESLTLVSVAIPDEVGVSLEQSAGQPGRERAGQAWELIRFEADGAVEAVTIELTDGHGEVRTVQIVPGTGQVVVSQRR